MLGPQQNQPRAAHEGQHMPMDIDRLNRADTQTHDSHNEPSGAEKIAWLKANFPSVSGLEATHASTYIACISESDLRHASPDFISRIPPEIYGALSVVQRTALIRGVIPSESRNRDLDDIDDVFARADAITEPQMRAAQNALPSTSHKPYGTVVLVFHQKDDFVAGDLSVFARHLAQGYETAAILLGGDTAGDSSVETDCSSDDDSMSCAGSDCLAGDDWSPRRYEDLKPDPRFDKSESSRLDTLARMWAASGSKDLPKIIVSRHGVEHDNDYVPELLDAARGAVEDVNAAYERMDAEVAKFNPCKRAPAAIKISSNQCGHQRFGEMLGSILFAEGTKPERGWLRRDGRVVARTGSVGRETSFGRVITFGADENAYLKADVVETRIDGRGEIISKRHPGRNISGQAMGHGMEMFVRNDV